MHLAAAVDTLRSGGVVLHATEGVWGLACDPWSEQAVQRVLSIKQRSADKGLIVIAAQSDVFAPLLAQLSVQQREDIEATWPGPHTWILPDQTFPSWVRGVHPSVACRVPGHAQARALAREFAGPLVSTSANIAGQPSITEQAVAFAQFAQRVDYALPGEVGERGRASTIHQLDGSVLR